MGGKMSVAEMVPMLTVHTADQLEETRALQAWRRVCPEGGQVEVPARWQPGKLSS